jgi:hypothetical protein
MDGVRINPATDRVTHVRCVLTDSKTPDEWLTSSAVVAVAEVVS